MKNLYPFLLVTCFCSFFTIVSKSQPCLLLDATYITYESRCAATGSIKVNAFGGSGIYKYKTTGPVTTNFTTSDSITGLSAGIYTLIVNDVVTNCTISKFNIVVAGIYQDPRFTLSRVDVSCDNASNGSIAVNGQQFGRAPFNYSIIAPSPMGIGQNNAVGIFAGLMAGDYTIRMTDSCGGIQTRQITIVNYTWWIDSYSFTKTGCDEADGFIKVVDSRGNISTMGGIPGFTYGIVRSPGDTIWSSSPNFTFSLAGQSSFDVIARDSCGIIKKAPVTLSLAPQAGGAVHTYNYQCNFFSASFSTLSNFLNPDFCLYDSSDVMITCNGTGVFTNLAYGSYCIKAYDACIDTMITRCFSVSPPPVFIANNVQISDKLCTSFTAAITGQVGLTNPAYCLYDSADVLVTCNATGIFMNLPYQPYCIKTTDGCRDTTITRCFNVLPPTPFVPAVIDPFYITCTNFGIHVNGDSLTLPLYCLYDSNGVQIICNNTGVFDSIPLGNYCITVYDACTDTTIIRCLSVTVPVINNDIDIDISNLQCSTFTVTASSNNLIDPDYCLYNAADVLIACDVRGVFDDLPYGNYCIKARNACPDTTLISCFTATPPIPSVSASVSTYGNTCSTFSAQTGHEQNLTNPTYCIYDSHGTLIDCNTRGAFTDLPYGSYCIKITDGCYDTSITRCFTESPVMVDLAGNAGKSCSFGYAQFNLNMGGGYLPVNIKIYNPDGSLYSVRNYNSNSVLIDSIPGVPAGETYKIVVQDNCGNKDSLFLGSAASYFDHSPAVTAKCPGASWLNGSGDIATTISTNLGSPTARIIKKNGSLYVPALLPNFVAAGVYTFTDLGPGTYIIRSTENQCNKYFYDTVTINPYQYPNLNQSSAYQCDVNGFSVGAVAMNGVAPFLYEIIGSQPTAPSIISGPQSSPIFNINNGSNYSLIRLRALDACGNATLGDASILPLSINGIVSTWDCLAVPVTLTVDSIFNSTYMWYKKLTESSTDSIFLGSGASYYIPSVLPSDTGIYVCHVTVNSGCINRTYNYHLDGSCWVVLAGTLETFNGQVINGQHLLHWKTSNDESLEHFIIERKNDQDDFIQIGRVGAIRNSGAAHQYDFIDQVPLPGKNFYRLKMENTGRSFSYSNIVLLNNNRTGNHFGFYPNPVKEKLTVDFGPALKYNYKIRLLNTMNQLVKEIFFTGNGTGKLEIPRPTGLQKGLYILRIIDLDSKEVFTEKIMFE